MNYLSNKIYVLVVKDREEGFYYIRRAWSEKGLEAMINLNGNAMLYEGDIVQRVFGGYNFAKLDEKAREYIRESVEQEKDSTEEKPTE